LRLHLAKRHGKVGFAEGADPAARGEGFFFLKAFGFPRKCHIIFVLYDRPNENNYNSTTTNNFALQMETLV